MTRSSTVTKDLTENPLRKPVNTLAIVPTKSSKITVLARKAYNVLLYIAQEQGIDQEVFRAPLQSILRCAWSASVSRPLPNLPMPFGHWFGKDW